jgi:hypothetical protein
MVVGVSRSFGPTTAAKRSTLLALLGWVTLMKTSRSAGHPGWLSIVVGEFSAYSYVAILAIYAGGAMADAFAGDKAAEHGFRGKWLLAFGAICVVNYCFPKYKWLIPFGLLVNVAAFLVIGLLDPRNDYAAKVGIGFVACIELLYIIARRRVGGGFVY